MRPVLRSATFLDSTANDGPHMAMTSTRAPQWDTVYERVVGGLQTVLDPEETRGRRVRRLLDAASACGAINAALANALEEWNATHPDALLCLPTELVNSILRLLDFRGRITVSHVSRGWRTMALADPFLWNVACFAHGRRPLVYFPSPGRPNKKPPPRPPPPRKADILRELLVRSDPAPFPLSWDNQPLAQLPDEMAELVLQNMHRMAELTVDLSEKAFARLFSLPAPALRTLSCTTHSAPCELPARWDAPVLQKLELGVVRVPVGMQPLRTVEILICHARRGLTNGLFALFPALTSLYIEAATPEVVRCLGNPPTTLAQLTLRTDDAAAIDYAELLRGCRVCGLELLRLESVSDLAPALELFTSVVEGTWSLEVTGANHHVELLALDSEDMKFEIDLAAPLSFEGETRIPEYFERVSALSADVALVMQMGTRSCTLPSLRELTLEFTRRPQTPIRPRAPIWVPQLKDVSVILDAEADGAALWTTEEFPAILRSRFAYDRPLLASISIDADSDVASELNEPSLLALRALAEFVRVEVLGETREYTHEPLID